MSETRSIPLGVEVVSTPLDGFFITRDALHRRADESDSHRRETLVTLACTPAGSLDYRCTECPKQLHKPMTDKKAPIGGCVHTHAVHRWLEARGRVTEATTGYAPIENEVIIGATPLNRHHHHM